VAAATLTLLPLTASAQSAFAGVVRDESGGVLPGVTVEAASPALIERVRNAITDEQGRYRIVDLRPGIYTITFSLVGFSTFVRRDLELPANVVLTINADMKVGGLQETLTVTGQTPVVDVQQAANTQVLTRDVQDELPTAHAYNSIAALAPGLRYATPDTGGSQMTNPTYLHGHGVNYSQTTYLVDGFSLNLYEANLPPYFNEALQSEISFTTSAIPAETAGGGYRQASSLKDGGNTFSASGYAGGTSGNWLATNISPEIIARGVRTGNSTKHVELFNASLGGPILKDKLWFLGAARSMSSAYRIANQPADVVLPNGQTLGTDSQDRVNDGGLRLTWQASQTVKFSGYFERYFKAYRAVAAGMDPQAAPVRDPAHAHTGMGNGKVTWTPSDHWLVEAGWGTAFQFLLNGTDLPYLNPPVGSPDWYALVRKTDTQLHFGDGCVLPTGCTTWGAPIENWTLEGRRDAKASVSYVTGAHNIKTGFVYDYGPNGTQTFLNGDVVANYVSGKPSSVTVFNAPIVAPMYVKYDIGAYIQDSWTLKRLTISPGVRVEWFDSYMRATDAPAGRFVPARSTPDTAYEPIFGPDVAPRFAVAYDLFGNGKAAIKGNVSKYYEELTGLASLYAAAGTSTDTRNWFDCALIPGTSTCSGQALSTNGDGIVQDNEVGPSTNPFFGQAPSRFPAPDLKRSYNWEYSVGVQLEVLPRMSVSATYFRRTWGNIRITKNSLVSPGDYTSFQTPMPSVSNDPAVSAIINPSQPVTVYNLNKARQPTFNTQLLDINAPNDKSIYNGVEVSFNGRFGSRGNVFANWNIERNLSVFCTYNGDPNGPMVPDLYNTNVGAIGISSVSNGGPFCDQRKYSVPFLQQFKILGNFPIWRGIETALVWQSNPGRERPITWTVPANLFPGGRTNSETVLLNPPGSLYEPRWNEFDINLRKNFKFGRHILTGEFDLYNAFNTAAILATLDSVGASLGTVTQTLNGRTPRIALQYKF
jgi:hypothetical protein